MTDNVHVCRAIQQRPNQQPYFNETSVVQHVINFVPFLVSAVLFPFLIIRRTVLRMIDE